MNYPEQWKNELIEEPLLCLIEEEDEEKMNSTSLLNQIELLKWLAELRNPFFYSISLFIYWGKSK